jgi:hypothetical protein
VIDNEELKCNAALPSYAIRLPQKTEGCRSLPLRHPRIIYAGYGRQDAALSFEERLKRENGLLISLIITISLIRFNELKMSAD